MPTLIESLRVKHLQTQLQAYSALLLIVKDDPEALANTLREVSLQTRWATPYLLPQFGPRAKDAVQPLIKLLEDPDLNVRVTSAIALGNLGSPTAAEAVPALIKCLNDPEPPVRMSAAAALAAMDPPNLQQAGMSPRRSEAFTALEKAAFQVEQVYIASQNRLAQLTGGRPLLNPAALSDPVLQGQYNYIVNTFIVALNFYPYNKGECSKLIPIQQAARSVLMKLGPEATPALVRGLNYVGRYNIGFT